MRGHLTQDLGSLRPFAVRVALIAQHRCRSLAQGQGVCLLQQSRILAPFSKCQITARRRHRRHVRAHAAQLTAAPVKQAPAETYLLTGSAGSKVAVRVEKQSSSYKVHVSVERVAGDSSDELSMIWGTYRTSPAKWLAPEAIKPPAGSSRSPSTGRVTSVLARAGSCYEAMIEVPAQLAPLSLAFQLQAGGARKEELGSAGRNFAVPIGMSPGRVAPMGASLLSSSGASSAVNFVVRSRGASAVALILARKPAPDAAATGKKPGGCLEIALDPVLNRTGDLWHVAVQGLKDLSTLCYAWRAEGDLAWEDGDRFYPGQVMFDPYAAALTTVQLPEGTNVVPAKAGAAANGNGAAPAGSNPPATMGCLCALAETFDWGTSQRPDRALEDALMLEVDPVAFTSGAGVQDEVPIARQRKLLGIVDRLKRIQGLGATAVMLAPIAANAPGLGLLGRAPVSYFAPEPKLAVSQVPGAAGQELKQLVKALHDAGLEVLLQVEFCFTGEGSDSAPAPVSLRGLDAAVYYRSGSLLNCGHAAVRALIVDALRHWAAEYDIDGFCFVNAENMAQDRHGTVLDNPPLPEEIALDPVLGALKLVAWSGNDALLPRGGDRGFPHWAVWAQRNTRFSADFRAFLAGAPGMASAIATRLTGSADIFAARWDGGLPGGLAAGRRPAFGLNSMNYLGRGTLWDLVASLVPADAEPPAIGRISQHETLAKTLLLLTMVSQGVPTLAQDILEDPRLEAAAQRCGALRRVHARLLAPPEFSAARDLRWHGAGPGSEPDWEGTRETHDGLFLAYSLHDAEAGSLYIGLNPHHYTIGVSLPAAPGDQIWRRAADTSLAPPLDFTLEPGSGDQLPGGYYDVAGKSALVLTAPPPPPPPKPAAQAPGAAAASVPEKLPRRPLPG